MTHAYIHQIKVSVDFIAHFDIEIINSLIKLIKYTFYMQIFLKTLTGATLTLDC